MATRYRENDYTGAAFLETAHLVEGRCLHEEFGCVLCRRVGFVLFAAGRGLWGAASGEHGRFQRDATKGGCGGVGDGNGKRGSARGIVRAGDHGVGGDERGGGGQRGGGIGERRTERGSRGKLKRGGSRCFGERGGGREDF